MTDSKKKTLPEHMLFKSHPWHGLNIGKEAPETVNCYIEMVPTDTVKYEIDKTTGILKVDRPQKYSSLCPTLYGFLPRTYAGDLVASHCMKKTGKKEVKGDGDPLDICVLTEKTIVRGDLIVRAHPIGGFRLIDGDQADDKIIAVLFDDFVYGEMQDVSQCPKKLIERLRHYFLSYKDVPGETGEKKVEITHIFGRKEAHQIINLSQKDYQNFIFQE